MIVRKNGYADLSIDKSRKYLKITNTYILDALYLAESLGCECYAVNSDNVICASILLYGRRCRVFKIKRYKNRGPEIFFSSGLLSDDLIKKCTSFARCTCTKYAYADRMFKLADLPLEDLTKYCECVIKARRDLEDEKKMKRKGRCG